jgi:endonuclease/exonuclease/phosphatase (EEP) superfamily protein YafD
VRFADLHHCPTGSTFLAFEVELRATAMNHAGLTATTPNAVVHHSGPDSLKVATLNLADPELRRMSATDRTAALTRYGRELIAQADIASVQELGDESFLPVIAQAAGLSHYTARPHQLDVAILSRYPLTDAADYSFEGGAIYAATALIDGVDHRIFALHWKHRPEPWVTDIHRLEAARLVRDLSAAETFAIAAGDLNVCATSIATNADECEGRDAPGVETATLGEAMADAFLKVPSARHCSNKRIDVVFVRGYDVSAYDGCQDSNPSDDPFVLVGLSAPPGGPYQGECK